VKKCGTIAVAASIELYQKISEGLLPTPAKFHYTFNLRDICKLFQGMLMTSPKSVSTVESFTNLWIHEATRVFNDRLTNNEDRHFFKDLLVQLMEHRFREKRTIEDIFINQNALAEEKPIIMFSQIMKLDMPPDEQTYEEI